METSLSPFVSVIKMLVYSIMSLKHIENRRDPTIFGADLNVFLGDVTVNGDLTVIGTINGNSAQGQNGNNIWTGTNEWSVYRPQTSITFGAGFNGVNLVQSQNQLATQGITNAGATWTGTNTFTNQFTVQGGSSPVPVAGTDGVQVVNAQTIMRTKKASFLTANQTWTNSNVFQVLPICIDPVLGPEIATKNYVDTTTVAVVGKSQTVVSQDNLTDTFATSLAVQVQCIGGGGGSTSGFDNSTGSIGWAGGGGSTGSLLVLNRAIGGVSQATWLVNPGVGGIGGIGTTPPDAYSGSGGLTYIAVVPPISLGLGVTIFGASGGSGNQGFSGDTSTGPSLGGVYTNALNTLVSSPLCSASGNNGTLGGYGGTQSSGLQTFGWGGSAASNGNGVSGNRGGYGITKYIG